MPFRGKKKGKNKFVWIIFKNIYLINQTWNDFYFLYLYIRIFSLSKVYWFKKVWCIQSKNKHTIIACASHLYIFF